MARRELRFKAVCPKFQYGRLCLHRQRNQLLLSAAFNLPINAALAGDGQNTWTVETDINWVRVFNGGATETSYPSGTATTHVTTHPATTGTVVVSQPYGKAFTLHSAQGSDNRTAKGAGNITLVTGWLAHRMHWSSTSDFAGTTSYKFHFAPVSETPSLATPTLGALAGLMLIAAVYVIRKRSFDRNG